MMEKEKNKKSVFLLDRNKTFAYPFSHIGSCRIVTMRAVADEATYEVTFVY